MIGSDIIRGYIDPIILSILMVEDSYGYEISKKISDISDGQYVIKETTLYSAFNRLSKNGYIEPYSGNETHGKKRTYYRITQEGVLYFKEKAIEWDLTKQVVNKFIKGVAKT